MAARGGGHPGQPGCVRAQSVAAHSSDRSPIVGGPACIKFAADCPDRVAGLILFASLAKGSASPDYPHALQAGQYDMWLQQLVAAWGGPAGIETFAPSLASDPQARAWWASLLR